MEPTKFENGKEGPSSQCDYLKTPNKAPTIYETVPNLNLNKSVVTGITMSPSLILESQGDHLFPDEDQPTVPPCHIFTRDSPSESAPTTLRSSSLNHIGFPSSSSSPCSPAFSLSPPLLPDVELSAVLTDTRLTLDVYRGGAAALPLLWASVPAKIRYIWYLRLGSEEKSDLEEALLILQHLTELRSLAIRGNCLYDSKGEPLPGLLTTLPSSVSSLEHLKHLDLSFNQISCLPPCLLSLDLLSSLVLCHNRIQVLPPDICQLSSLTYLSLLGNKLMSLPVALGQLKLLQTLDVSHNLLQELPDEIGSLEELVELELSHNKLKRLPESLGSLSSLKKLAIYSNALRMIPNSLNKLPQLKIDARDNPLGKPPTPPPLPLTFDKAETTIPEMHVRFDQHSFWISPAGCHVFLPGGAELVFPPRCVATLTKLKWSEKCPDRKWVWLEEHDLLLSRPLELRPHGLQFLKPVQVRLPYRRKKGEVMVRKFDGQIWSTLATELMGGSRNNGYHLSGRPVRLACCLVRGFSWFMVVSRLPRDTCSVTPAGALLVSSLDSRIKLHFPPDSTSQTRSVTLRVLNVSESAVQVVCGDPLARMSPLLCLTQNPSLHFLQPVKVQIPLPSGLTGHTTDVSRLHLLHGDSAGQTWTDITSQVSLYVTHLYAIFYITHFSWYWLWYTTQRCVSGVVRKVYQKLKQFKVQFLVLQRRTDPSQVLLQCLPANKVDNRVKCLSEQYDGPQPSDLCDLLEGEEFFAGFERGLEISTDRPDCVQGRLCFVFYSSLKNLKEVYICPVQGQTEPVRGQVSFYRGQIPSSLPEEVVKKRKGLDSQWLATLPVKLPALNSDNGFIFDDHQYPPLNLGDPESGYLTETNLLSISLQIGQDWRVIGINLGLSYQELDRIQYKFRDNLGALVLDMLFYWARAQKSAGPGAVSRLTAAMIESGRTDLADEIKDIVVIGKKKYLESLKRLGLEDESPSPGEAQQ